MTLTRKLEILSKQFNFSVKKVDDEESEVFTVEGGFIIGFYKQEEEFFLQKIVHFPGSYYDPPSEDFVDLVVSKDFDIVVQRLMQEITILVLDHIKEEEYYSKEESNGF